MRIALVADRAGPLGVTGQDAAQARRRHVVELAAGLARQGHHVTVYTRSTRPDLPERTLVDGFAVVHVPAGPHGRLPDHELAPHLGTFADYLAARWRRDPPDVAHAHRWTSGVAAVLAASGTPVPVVQTYHGLGGPPGEGGQHDPRARLERMLGRRAVHVAASSGDEVQELARMGVPRTRVTVLPCGVDLARFTPHGRAAPRSARHRLVTAGRLADGEGIDLAIRALRRLPHAELLIVGGPERHRLTDDLMARRLAALAGAEQVADRVRLLGRVPGEHLPGLLRSADAVVCAPRRDPCGSLALAAMACGVPVVAAAVGGLADTVVDGVTGALVPPARPDLLARSLRTLLADSGLRFSLGVAGCDRAHSRYSWDRIAGHAVSMYQRVVGEAAEAATPTGTAGYR
jgi:glycosyltransferase involved in cell wall biosynthesis